MPEKDTPISRMSLLFACNSYYYNVDTNIDNHKLCLANQSSFLFYWALCSDAESVTIQSTSLCFRSLLVCLCVVFSFSYSAWPDKSKEEDNNAKNKSKQVSGLASLMAYEGDSDDDST